MRFHINPFRQTGVVPQPPRDAVRSFHRSLPGYQPTPLRSLPALAHELGLGRILVKDEGQRFGLKAFKGLGASWAIHRLQREGVALTTVASATEGNHGRAVAWTARLLGLRAVIFMTNQASPVRISAIEGEGAQVIQVDGTYEDAVQTCARRSAAEGWQVVADVGYEGYMEIPRWITQGYGTLLQEIDEQRAGADIPQPDVVIAQAGVGGFAAAVVDHFLEREAQPRIVIVEPVEADPALESSLTPDGSPAQSTGSQHTMMGGLNCSTVSYSAWPVLRNGADMFLTIQDLWGVTAMRRYAKPLASDPPVIAGESGAAGLAALLALMSHQPFQPAREHLGLGPDSTVLLFITEGDTDPDAWRRIVVEGGP